MQSSQSHLISVGDIINQEIKFFIPYYQRGYRWERSQIEALLNDLWEFHRKIKRKEEGYKYYSLQPLVIKEDKNYYRVVDGQQRLTTIYIILQAIEKILKEEVEKFHLEYEREYSKEFLMNIKNCENFENNNLDFCYMCNAFKIVMEWIENKNISKQNLRQFRDFIITDSYIDEKTHKDENENIRFIWYKIDENEDEFDVFIRLNIGKIPLTNTELIKSFIIQKSDSLQKRFEISKEWDDIEYELANDEFFGFLSTKEYQMRIEIIFQILMAKDKYKEYGLYEEFIEKYNNADFEEIWDSIKAIFYMLKFWYENRYFYHLIGYLISIGKNIVDIYQLYIDSNDKNDFKLKLNEEIKNSINIEVDEIENLSYGDKKINNILLLFNILTLIDSSKDSYIKFSFDKFNKEKWSIEHITPQVDKIRDSKNIIEDIRKLNIEDLEKKLKNFEKNKDFKKFILGVEKLFIDNYFKTQENKDNIRNLTLLSTRANSSLKNAFFPIKRNFIIEKDKKGEFIPIVTKNLFLKYYSDATKSDLLKWTKNDGDKYIESIKETFRKFFSGVENE